MATDTVLVTGGTGNIGAAFVAILAGTPALPGSAWLHAITTPRGRPSCAPSTPRP